MAIYKPKIIDLGNKVAITGDKILILSEKSEFNEKKEEIYTEIKKSFSNLDYNGFCCRADINTLSVTFIPTMRCNLRCIYCYSDGGFDSRDLSTADAIFVLNQLIKQYPDAKEINLYFAGGGEPLLNFSVIDGIVQYVKDQKLTPHIRIVTNGTLIQDHIDWLKSNNVYLRVSYDGSFQSQTRPGVNFDSQKKLRQTFELLKEEYPSELLSIQMTITRFNVANLSKDVTDIINNYGINTIKIEPVQTSCSSRSKKVDRPSVIDFVSNFLEMLNVLIENKIKAYIDTSYLSVPSVGYFCSLRNKIVVSPYGLLTPCVEIINTGVVDDIILWKLDNKGINFMIRNLQNERLYPYHPKNYKVCSDCNLVHICKGNCPMRLILDNKKEGPYNYNCSIAQKLILSFLQRSSSNEDYLRLVFGESFEMVEKCE